MKTTTFAIALTVLALGVGVMQEPAAAKRLEETFIRIEINATDGDGGIHVFLDGEGWDTMQMTGPNGDVMFSVAADSSLGMQGINEIFFESAEPSFDVQPLDELLEMFPAGVYRFLGTTTKGRRLRGRARLNHRIPDAPVQLSPVDGEEVDPENAVFTWAAVDDPPGGEIAGYEVIVECDEPEVEFLAQVEPEITSITVPPEFLDQDNEDCKWEVLAIEDGGNQIISETEFSLD